jgi:hypothetical protein
MSITQLKSDLNILKDKLASSPPQTASDIVAFLQGEFVPWAEAAVDELAEMDEVIEGVVTESDDVLHTENAAVFATVITGGLELAQLLAQRAGNDKVILGKIAAFRDVAKNAEEILEEITFEDDDEDDDAAAPAANGATREGDAT